MKSKTALMFVRYQPLNIQNVYFTFIWIKGYGRHTHKSECTFLTIDTMISLLFIDIYTFFLFTPRHHFSDILFIIFQFCFKFIVIVPLDRRMNNILFSFQNIPIS